MNFVLTFTLRDALLLLIGIAALVLLIYLIVLFKNLVPAVKTLNEILDDSKRITGIAAESAEEAKEVAGDVTKIVSTISENLKGNQSIVAALTSIVNALTSLKNLLIKAKQD